MKILDNITLEDISNNYKYVAAWGTGTLFRGSYIKDELKIDYLIDGTLKNEEEAVVDDKKVFSPEILRTVNGKTIVIIFTIYEREIEKQINSLGVDVDYIIYQKIRKSNEVISMKYNMFYSKDAEDIILSKLINDRGISNIEYLDIGVCHPVFRNNTYFLYEMGFKGVLIEPNPDYSDLINQYRARDKLISCGASDGENTMLEYYLFFRRDGFNTFVKEQAQKNIDKGYPYEIKKIPVININQIIREHFENYPQVLDIDAEGFDYRLLKELDSSIFKINIIICETGSRTDEFDSLMNQKNYEVYARIAKNTIYVLNG